MKGTARLSPALGRGGPFLPATLQARRDKRVSTGWQQGYGATWVTQSWQGN